MVALMVGLLLLNDEGRSDKNHHLNNDFIPGPVPTAFRYNHHNNPMEESVEVGAQRD